MSPTPPLAPEPRNGFADSGISRAVSDILSKQGFTTPTPIQEKAIPVVLTGKDLIGIAQTGTGKTLAFGLPLLDQLSGASGRALVLVPTRELALQVEEGIRRISRSLNPAIRSISLIGGEPIYRQIRELKARPRIIVATPGRLQDHLTQKTLNLDEVRILVLDEADRMLDMGFEPQIKRILQSVPSDRQTLLFSATMPLSISQLTGSYMKDPVTVEINPGGTSAEGITQEICYIRQDDKTLILEQILRQSSGPVLVFSRTKHGAARLSLQVQRMGYSASEIHSNRSLNQRRAALEGFRSGRYRVLVATDIAARGIDVRDIAVVVNYDLPDVAEDYVHRIGRTGRAGKDGYAISLATPDQHRDVQAIERVIKKKIPLAEGSLDVQAQVQAASARGGSRRSFHSSRGHRRR